MKNLIFKTSLKLLSSILLLTLIINVNAQTFTIGSFKYKINNNGVSVAATSKNLFGNVIIPQTITYSDTEYKVTAIADSGFSNCTGIRSIILPTSIISIGNSAFANCKNLAEINLPTKLQYIGNGAFYNCGTISAIDLPTTLKTIGKYAFAYCSALRGIDIKEETETIDEMAFWECQSLRQINLAKNVKKIGDRAISHCPQLCTINIDVNNKYYTIENNTLYTYDKTNIIAYPAASPQTECTIAKQCKKIPAFLFSDCIYLHEIILNDGLEEIENYAFTGNGEIIIKKIPNSVKRIGELFCPICNNEIEMPDSFEYVDAEEFNELSF